MLKDIGKVVVLAGGDSFEREVSLVSGKLVYEALLRNKVDAVFLDVQSSVIEDLKRIKPDFAFIVIHGAFGEDGRMQTLLDFLHIPYTGSPVPAMALTIEKPILEAYLKEFGFPVIPSKVAYNFSEYSQIINSLPDDEFPVCVKVPDSGSSLGVMKAHSKEEALAKYPELIKCTKSNLVMVQKWITGDELAVSILGGKALPVLRVIPKHEFYDYEAKYTDCGTIYTFDTTLTESQNKEIQNLAEKAFQIAGCQDFSRVDFIFEKETQKIWFLEINTIPGMTSHSLIPMAAKKIGLDYDALVLKILTQAYERYFGCI